MASQGGNRENLLKVLDLNARFPIANAICSYLSIADIISLTRTCKPLSGLYKDLIPSQWNVDQRLRDFCSNPQGFRAEMEKCGAVIVGAFAVAFFERTNLDNQFSLDIFMEEPAGRPPIMDYLEIEEGYRTTKSSQTDDFLCDDSLWHTYRTPKGRICRLFCFIDTPVTAILREATSTLLATFISHNQAVSVFPRSSFIDHSLYYLDSNGTEDDDPSILLRWCQHGWSDLSWQEYPYLPMHSNPKERTKAVIDEKSWVINLPEFGSSSNEDSVLYENYVFSFDPCPPSSSWDDDLLSESLRAHILNFKIVNLVTLRHKYIVPRTKFPVSWTWGKYLQNKIYETARKDFEAMDEGDPKPARLILTWLQAGRMDTPYGEKPLSWRYVDHLIPGWYKDWKQIEYIVQPPFH